MPDVILFDGVCNFCNASINFIIDHDPQQRFRFAPLQSDYAQRTLQAHGRATHQLDTVLLIREGQVFERSEAALEIVRYLRGWSWVYVFRVVPRPVRDAIYDLIAKHRYRIFGRSDACRIPTPEERALFLS